MGAPDFDPEVALRALGHPGRRRMLELVWDAERTSSELAEQCGFSRPGASQHLKVLRDAALVNVRVDGTSRLYRADAGHLVALREFLDEFWSERLGALRLAAEGPRPRKRRRSP
jgi:DNA-binding transcriptional ArsR family regulator